MAPESPAASTPQISVVRDLGRGYMWWSPVGGGEHPFERIVAQIMNFGTYDDIRRLERAVDAGMLAGVMTGAQPGWFSDRSWEFWRGRLAFSIATTLPAKPPRRHFGGSEKP